MRIHPYELSYYNELIGGPRGAWDRGFELTYWYDAFNGPVIADLNRRLPPNAEIDFFNDLTDSSVIVFQELQSLGVLRGDIRLAATGPGYFPLHLAVDAGLEGGGIHAALVRDAPRGMPAPLASSRGHGSRRWPILWPYRVLMLSRACSTLRIAVNASSRPLRFGYAITSPGWPASGAMG